MLSIARRAGGWISEAVRVSSPAPTANQDGEIVLEAFGIALTPPSRFHFEGVHHRIARFHRVSLAGNDGVQQLTVEIHPKNTRLADLARDALSEPGAPEVHGSVTIVDGLYETLHARVALASVALGGNLAVLSLLTTPSKPADDIEQELGAAVSSCRALQKPWWKVW